MASDLAIVLGFTGLKKSRPDLKAVEIGEQPSACAPLIFVRTSSIETQGLHFMEALPDLGQERAGRHRNDHLVRRAPAELLDGLERQRLRAFRIVGANIDIHKGPAMFAGDLAAEAIDVVVIAFDLDHVRLIDQIPEDFRGFQIAGNEYVGAHPGGSRMGGDGIRQIAGRGTGNGFKAQFASPRDGHGHDSIFERQRGMIDRVVLDVELVQSEVGAEILGADQRGHPGMWAEKSRPFHRQEIGIPPDTMWPVLDLLPGNVLLDLLVVVFHFEGAEAHLADVDRLRRIFFPAFATDQRFHFAHGDSTLLRQ